jgi:methanethiol S-methyltransferase
VAALFSLLYGLVAYGLCLATLLYAIGFVGNVLVPKSIDTGVPAPLSEAVIVNVILLGLFAVQHSVMARRSFKRWWTRMVPPAVERSTYVLFASLTLVLLVWQWRPIPDPTIWRVDHAAGAAVLRTMFWSGWALLLVSTFLIDHFELFGLRQVHARFTERRVPVPEFRTPFLYRYVRHPIYLGLLLAFWSTPVMTAGHLLFSAMTTAYIFVGIWFEERDLVAQFGERYRRYRSQVGMLVPGRKREWADDRLGAGRRG